MPYHSVSPIQRDYLLLIKRQGHTNLRTMVTAPSANSAVKKAKEQWKDSKVLVLESRDTSIQEDSVVEIAKRWRTDARLKE